MSLATKYDVENVIEDISFRLAAYLICHKDWNKYSLAALFPTMNYLGSIFARYDIFQDEEKNYI